MAITTTFTWDDFSGGEFGDLPPYRVPQNMWTGINCLVYRNGEIGPRSGYASVSNTSLSPSGVGLVTDAGFANVSNSNHRLSYDTQMFVFDSGADSWTLMGNTGPAVSWVPVHATSATPGTVSAELSSVRNSHVYSIQHTGATSLFHEVDSATTAMGSFRAGGAITRFKDRFYASDSRNRVYYSDVDSRLTWSSSNFFEVGTDSSVFGNSIGFLGWQGDALVIILADSSVWEYRGVPGKDSLRRTHPGILNFWDFTAQRAAILPNGELIFVPPGKDYPALYSNGKITYLKHLKILEGDPGVSLENEVKIITTEEPDDVIILFNAVHPTTGKQRALSRKNGTWSFIEWDASPVVSIKTYASTDSAGSIFLNNSFTDVYVYSTESQRPGTVSSSVTSPGDLSNTPLQANFSTGEVWSRDGEMFTVEKVTVDFTKFQTGQTETSHFDVNVTVIAHGAEQGTTTQSYTAFDEANATATTAGTRDRHTARGTDGGPKRGSGVQITLDNIRACTIRAITITLKSDEGSLTIQPLS